MPPNLDVYVISHARKREAIDRFLNTYVNRAASEDRGDEELMLVPLNLRVQPADDEWEWELSRSLAHIVERGLEYPRRAFAAYLEPLDKTLTGAILAFTTDDRVIFSLSLDDEGGKRTNVERAKALLHEIARDLEGCEGFIGVETPPPLFGTRDKEDIVVYSWTTSSSDADGDG